MQSIIIIIPYFGKFPSTFKFWKQSALNNPNIDFLILTDNDLHNEKNIYVIKTTFAELRNKIQTLYDFPISLPSPYKLCDYRPAYGEIFYEDIKSYDFWGFGDIDLIYGNIRSIITDNILDKYYVISGWGHLTLYKNNNYCNTFYQRSIKGFQFYKTVFSTPKNCFFDEYLHKGIGDLWKHINPESVWDVKPFDDIRVPYLNFNFISEFHPEYSSCLIFEYKNNTLYRIYITDKGEIRKESSLYAHFQKRNILKIKTNNTNHYLIIPNAFINYEDITYKKLIKWGKEQNIKKFLWNLKNKITRHLKWLHI